MRARVSGVSSFLEDFHLGRAWGSDAARGSERGSLVAEGGRGSPHSLSQGWLEPHDHRSDGNAQRMIRPLVNAIALASVISFGSLTPLEHSGTLSGLSYSLCEPRGE